MAAKLGEDAENMNIGGYREDAAEFLKVASARAALGATSPVVEPHLHP